MEFIDFQYDWKDTTLCEFLVSNKPSGWTEFFNRKDVSEELSQISEKIDQTTIIYPEINDVFRAFYITPLNKIKVVMIGMDPYHNGSAMGLCFSVKHGNKINPSLRNIYKELKMEGFNPEENGDLKDWARKGILMINMALTVEKSKPGSHSNLWKKFSEKVVSYICDKCPNVQWILLGNDAHKVKKNITSGTVHLTSHPSPFAAYRQCGEYPAFIGSDVFKVIFEDLGIYPSCCTI